VYRGRSKLAEWGKTAVSRREELPGNSKNCGVLVFMQAIAFLVVRSSAPQEAEASGG